VWGRGKELGVWAEFCVLRAAFWRKFDKNGRAAFGRKFWMLIFSGLLHQKHAAVYRVF